MKAVILIGGPGKHLIEGMSGKPKSLMVIGGKPLIDWQLGWLRDHSITSVIMLAGPLGGAVAEYVGTGRQYGMNVSFVFEEKPLGTAGAIRNAFDLLNSEEMFFAMNGDVITNIDLYKIRLKEKDVATVATVPLKTTYGIATVKEEKITRFLDRPRLEDYWLNAGVYLISNRIFSYLPDVGNLERSTFPRLAREGKLGCYRTLNTYWYSVDSERDLLEVEKELTGKGKKT